MADNWKVGQLKANNPNNNRKDEVLVSANKGSICCYKKKSCPYIANHVSHVIVYSLFFSCYYIFGLFYYHASEKGSWFIEISVILHVLGKLDVKIMVLALASFLIKFPAKRFINPSNLMFLGSIISYFPRNHVVTRRSVEHWTRALTALGKVK